MNKEFYTSDVHDIARFVAIIFAPFFLIGAAFFAAQYFDKKPSTQSKEAIESVISFKRESLLYQYKIEIKEKSPKNWEVTFSKLSP